MEHLERLALLPALSSGLGARVRLQHMRHAQGALPRVADVVLGPYRNKLVKPCLRHDRALLSIAMVPCRGTRWAINYVHVIVRRHRILLMIICRKLQIANRSCRRVIRDLHVATAFRQRGDAAVVLASVLLLDVGRHLAGVQAVGVQVVAEQLPVLQVDRVGLVVTTVIAGLHGIHRVQHGLASVVLVYEGV